MYFQHPPFTLRALFWSAATCALLVHFPGQGRTTDDGEKKTAIRCVESAVAETGARPKQYVPAPEQNIWRASVLSSDDEDMLGSDVEGDAAATTGVRQDVQKSERSGQAKDIFKTLFDEVVLEDFAELSLETTAEKSDQKAVGANNTQGTAASRNDQATNSASNQIVGKARKDKGPDNTQEIALSDLCLEGEWGHLLEPQGRPTKKAIRKTNKSS